jgi:hypothetical protein
LDEQIMSFESILAAAKPWAFRLAITAAVTLVVSFPVHFFVARQANGILMGVAVALFCSVVVSSVVARRFWPIALAIIGMILHAATLPAG